MSADKKSIFVWSPFISKVGTVQNVINSLNSINKYSKFNTNLINVFGEWDPSLAFVMIGALIISSPLFHLFKNKEKPIFANNIK